MTTKQARCPRIIVTVSEPYHTVGFQGGRYGQSATTKRDYRAIVSDRVIRNTSKDEIKSQVRFTLYRTTGKSQARFLFVPEGICAYGAGADLSQAECAGIGCQFCAGEMDLAGDDSYMGGLSGH